MLVGPGRSLVVGPLVAMQQGAALQSLQMDGVTLIAEIGLGIRNRLWHTLAPQSLRRRSCVDRWGGLVLRGKTAVEQSSLAWQVTWTGHADGLDVELTMRACGAVTVNRAGLVLLLPCDRFAGAPAVITDALGGRSEAVLPLAIAAHQPLPPLRAVEVRDDRGWQVRLEFEGDDFEVEDHRNWLDPCFKFYNRPLSAPTPYRIEDGQEIHQRIRVAIRRGTRPCAGVVATPAAPTARMRAPEGRLPVLGLNVGAGQIAVDGECWRRIGEVGATFASIRILQGEGGLLGALLARARAARLQPKLVLVRVDEQDVQAMAPCLVAPDRAEVHSIACHAIQPPVMRMLEHLLPDALRVVGTFGDFVHVNRAALVPAPHEAFAFALCPTVHATDDHSLLRSLGALPAMVEQARRMAGGASLWLGPCNLRRDLHPATGSTSGLALRADGLPDDVDPRQMLPIAAAWLACAIALCGWSGVDALCTFDAVGPRGVVDTRFGIDQARLSPSGLVLQALAPRQGVSLAWVSVDMHQQGLFVLAGPCPEVWVVELAGRPLELPLAGLAPARVRVLARRRDQYAWWPVPLPRPVLRLQAYQTARIDLQTQDPGTQSLDRWAQSVRGNRLGVGSSDLP